MRVRDVARTWLPSVTALILPTSGETASSELHRPLEKMVPSCTRCRIVSRHSTEGKLLAGRRFGPLRHTPATGTHLPHGQVRAYDKLTFRLTATAWSQCFRQGSMEHTRNKGG